MPERFWTTAWLARVMLVSLLVLLVSGWLIDRNSLLKQNHKMWSSMLKMKSAADIASSTTNISESDLLVLLRWCGKGEFFRTVYRHKLFKKDGSSDFKDFDEAVNFELIHCVSDAFRLESDLIRLEISPSPIKVAKEAMEYLECNDQSKFWQMALDLGFNINTYEHFEDHFKDPNSAEHLKFVAFLDRVFSE